MTRRDWQRRSASETIARLDAARRRRRPDRRGIRVGSTSRRAPPAPASKPADDPAPQPQSAPPPQPQSAPPAAAETLDAIAARKLRALDGRRLRRHLIVTERRGAAAARRNGRDLISFSCNDYLGLAHHPAVVEAAIEATRRYGAGAGASRLVTGNHPLYEELERRLADLKGAEAAVVFGSGYLANTGTIAALVGAQDLILTDELSHSCIAAGAALSRARVLAFRHNDAEAAGGLLERYRGEHRHCLIVTEGVFSMDGDLAPLPELARLAARHAAWLMTDDAHALGVVGGGRGSKHAHGETIDVPLQMGTLSKAVGAYGGYVCASTKVAEWLRNRARTLVYSTGLPPGVVAAASAALRLIDARPELATEPVRRAALFVDTLVDRLRPMTPERSGAALPRSVRSAIVPLVVGSAERALTLAEALERRGFLVVAIRPPTVPSGTARLRFAFSAEHDEDDVLRLAEAVAQCLTSRGAVG
ncbi:MAG: 8-amino-7-oxononanoate synthase [Gammaproteobacteria bacterium]|nr:8-amino-7-oxononanoate synthase [Gammaproteobacteria bacterium]